MRESPRTSEVTYWGKEVLSPEVAKAGVVSYEKTPYLR